MVAAVTVVGVDLSTRALDLVKLDDDTNRAEWVRCELVGADAWERTLRVRWVMYDFPGGGYWWEGVHLVAIEAPYGRGQAGTNALLNRVVGAVAASLPAHLRDPARCWVVRPDEWKAGLGLKGKPTGFDLVQLTQGDLAIITPQTEPLPDMLSAEWQNARDAYCLALFARGELERGVQEAV